MTSEPRTAGGNGVLCPIPESQLCEHARLAATCYICKDLTRLRELNRRLIALLREADRPPCPWCGSLNQCHAQCRCLALLAECGETPCSS